MTLSEWLLFSPFALWLFSIWVRYIYLPNRRSPRLPPGSPANASFLQPRGSGSSRLDRVGTVAGGPDFIEKDVPE